MPANIGTNIETNIETNTKNENRKSLDYLTLHCIFGLPYPLLDPWTTLHSTTSLHYLTLHIFGLPYPPLYLWTTVYSTTFLDYPTLYPTSYM